MFVSDENASVGALGAVVSIFTSCVETAEALPATSVAKYLTVVVAAIEIAVV